MRSRRDFITLLGGAAGWPITARAQQTNLPLIGFLSSGTPGPRMDVLLAAFRRGLAENGYAEGRDVAIEYRWANGRNEAFPELLADLLRRKVAVIATTGGDAPAFAAKAATSTIPIVFTTTNDPVQSGLVSSLNRPGGNATGVSRLGQELIPKRLQMLAEVVPGAATIAFLVNPRNVIAEPYAAQAEVAAQSLGRTLRVLKAADDAEITAVFTTLTGSRVGAMLISNDPFFFSRARQLGELSLRHMMPALYVEPDFVEAGGLMSYGDSLAGSYRLVGAYTGRIIKGEKPADLPVQQQTKIEFILNLKTARALGLNIPVPLLGRADEVIE
jgi:ABC-type uncharacterized transport system substrate-binding protein